MQFRQLILAASALVMAGASRALGQGPSAPVAGDSVLQSLVAEALARNPTVAQRQAAVRAATLRIRPAGSLPDPMLTLGVMDLVLPHFEFNQSDFTEADVELSQEIPWPGSLGARSGVMRAAAAGARAEQGTVRRDLTTSMAVAYYRLGYAVTALGTLRHQRELLGAAVDAATRTIQVERLGARPDFTLMLRYGYRPQVFSFNFPDFFSAFVGLRLPIWAWRKQNRLADAAHADSTGAAAELRDAELQLSREVTEAAARVQASLQRLALLVDGVLPNARGTVESVLRSYQVGRAEFLTLRSEEHTSELQSQSNLVCRLLLEKKKTYLRATSGKSRGPAAPAPRRNRRRATSLTSRQSVVAHSRIESLVQRRSSPPSRTRTVRL